ncbi:MAG: protein methyltransferase HemK [Actinomycetota bacterium]|jgi:release factor glutamine methyltransferase
MARDTSGAVTWRTLLNETIEVLGERPQARWICETACGLDGDEFLAELDEPATERMVAQLDAMVARYRAGEPLAYVMGHWSFRTIELMVDRRVLIPRPETEMVAGRALELARGVAGQRRVVDLGTGSGAIGLSLAAELPLTGTEVWLTDYSTDAVDVARANAIGLGRAAANVRVCHGSWFDALPVDVRGEIDVVVSNPPYIADGDPEVAESVLEYEPHTALFAGDDGLDDVRTIARDAREWLRSGGWLVMEIGYLQGDAVKALLEGFGYADVTIANDLTGRPRIAEARNP